VVHPASFVAHLAAAEIGATFNQYADGPVRCERLLSYLSEQEGAELLLVGEAAGYRGARVSGLPFTSERQLTGTGPAEATATIVQRVLRELGIEKQVLLWNVVPTHPHLRGRPCSNRRPTAGEVHSSRVFLDELAQGRRVVAVGRLAEVAVGPPAIRHPSHGGAAAFREGLAHLV
jgi:uracil-DNA glycosylase